MSCAVSRCGKDVSPVVKRKGRLAAPLINLCGEHRPRYEREYRRHYVQLIAHLERQWKVGRKTARERADAVIDALSQLAHVKSWQNTWLMMVDMELLHAGHGGGQRVRETKEGYVPEVDPNAPRPSVVGITPVPAMRTPPPESATRAGQAAIAKREAEQQLLERQLAADRAEYDRGRRMELELELKTKRATEQLREAARRAKEKA